MLECYCFLDIPLAYVVIVSCNQLITLAKDKVIRAGEAVADAAFETGSCGAGERVPVRDWALIATADPRELLLIRRLTRADRKKVTVRDRSPFITNHAEP